MKNFLAFVFSMFVFSSFAGEVAVMHGKLDEFTGSTVTYTAGPIYKNGKFEIVPEFGLARYDAWNDSLLQIYVTPKFRYRFTKRWSVDAGVGVSWINQKHLGDGQPFQRKFGSNFQFNDHVGLNFMITDHVGLGYRITHFSNASIKKPNPGVNMQQIVLTYTY